MWAQQYLIEVDKRSGPVVARVLAYLIAGHHAGLDNWFGGLHERFNREDTVREGRDALAVAIPEAILKPSAGLPDLNAIRTDQKDNIPGRFALWVRMLFSCLVDADFLDTEAFMSQARPRHVPVSWPRTSWKCGLPNVWRKWPRKLPHAARPRARSIANAPKSCAPVLPRPNARPACLA